MEAPESVTQQRLRRGERAYMVRFVIASVLTTVAVSMFLREFDLRILILPPIPLVGQLINGYLHTEWIPGASWMITGALACYNVLVVRRKLGGFAGEFLAEERRFWRDSRQWSPLRRCVASAHFGVSRLEKHFYPTSSVVVGTVIGAVYVHIYRKGGTNSVLRIRGAFLRFVVNAQRVGILTLMFLVLLLFVG